MNTFILDRHTDPQNPTVTSVQNDRIPVYDTVADACADLANLEVGQIIATKEVEKSLFDYIYPIGSTYTQYPDCASPNELWPDTTWTELDFNGAFFRATGGLAQAFDNQTSMQGQGTVANGLSTEKFDANHRHCVSVTIRNGRVCAGCDYGNQGDRLMTNGAATNTSSTGFATATTVINTGSSTTKDLNHNHNLSSTDQETRPMNYTIKIWKRTA